MSNGGATQKMDYQTYLTKRKELVDELIALGEEYFNSGWFWQGDWREASIPETNEGLEDLRELFDTDKPTWAGAEVVLPSHIICRKCGEKEYRKISIRCGEPVVEQPPRLRGLCNKCAIEELEATLERARNLVSKVRVLKEKEAQIREKYKELESVVRKIVREIGVSVSIEPVENIVERLWNKAGFYNRKKWNTPRGKKSPGFPIYPVSSNYPVP